MALLYLTQDQIGTPSGGGFVTRFEHDAMASLGEEINQFDNTDIPACDDPFESDERFCRAMKRIVAECGVPKIVHCYAGCFTTTVQFLKSKGTKVTYTADAHDPDRSIEEFVRCEVDYPWRHMSDRNLRAMYAKGYTLADAVIVPSTHSERIMKAFGCSRVVVIPHPVRPFPELKFPKKFTVGYLGQGGPDKGLRYLLEAWRDLDLKEAKLVLAGNCAGTVIPLWRRHGGRDIVLLGFVEHEEKFYGRISIYVQPSVCLVPGSMVMANGYPKAIDFLNSSDFVLSADGTYRHVIRPIQNQYIGMLVSIRTSGIGIPTQMTEAHRVLCVKRGLESRIDRFKEKVRFWGEALRLHNECGFGSRRISRILNLNESMVSAWIYCGTKPEGRGPNRTLKREILQSPLQWVHASQLEKGDVVVFPRIKEEHPISRLKLPQRKTTSGPATRPLPKSVPANEDILKLIGYYISEGCGSRGSVAFCFNTKERDYIEDVSRTVKDMFGLRVREKASKIKKSLVVLVHSILFYEWLCELCGKGSHNVRMPSWALGLPKKQLVPMLRGMWNGDGSVFLSNGRFQAKYSTVSKVLAYQMFSALVKLGYLPCLYYNKKRKYSINLAGVQVDRFIRDILGRTTSLRKDRKRIVNQAWIDNKYYYSRITDISRVDYKGAVFNLEVQGNPSYAAPFVVHNSEGFGIPVIGAMACGRPVIASEGAGAVDAITSAPSQVGIRIPIRDTKAIADAVRFYAENPEKIKEHGQHAREASKAYAPDLVREKYVALWRSL